MANLAGTILSLAQNRGDAPSFRLQKESGGYRSVNWREYSDKSLRFSAFLKEQGIKEGDKVLLISENAPEWSMAALAVFNLGATLVPVASVASFLEVQNILQGSQAKFCILSKRIAAFSQINAELNAKGVKQFAWDVQQDDPLQAIHNSPLTISSIFSESLTAVLIYTSGTTGNPKAVPISHQNILANAHAVLKVLEAYDSDRLVSVLPLSHMLEFTGGFVVPALVGAQITYVKSLKAEDLLCALKDSKATIMIAVPLLFEIIARNLQAKLSELPSFVQSIFDKFSDLTRAYPWMGGILFYPIHRALGGSVRYFVAGGSKLHPQTFEFFRGMGITLIQGYGLTETSPVLTLTNTQNAAPDHVGLPMPNIELGIFNDQGARMPVGQEGEIWARGASVFDGYLHMEKTRDVFWEDWFRTGDLGTLDENGFLRITGRKKDIIVTPAGKNVYPEELEGLVLGTGLFLEACLLGITDQAGHEKICLVVLPDRQKFPGKTSEEISQEAVKIATESSRSLAEYKWPQRYEVVFEELPKTITRKIKKHEVRKRLLEKDQNASINSSEMGDGQGLDLSDELEATIAKGISSITKIDPAKIRQTDLLTTNLGLDSLTFVELVSHVEKQFGAQIEGIDFAAIVTVKDLVSALQFAAGSKKKKSFFKPKFVDFEPSDNARLPWAIPRICLNLLLRMYIRGRHGLVAEGLENLRGGGPFIFTPNHTSHFDMVSIASSIPLTMINHTYAVGAKDYFFNKTWKALFARVFMNAIPFDRKGRVDESMKLCRDALNEGGSLTIFPEGTRSPDGKLQTFKAGVGQLLAGHPKAQAVPVYIHGAYQIMPKGSKFPRAGQLRIRFGSPISFGQLEPSAESNKKIAERLREEVVKLSR